MRKYTLRVWRSKKGKKRWYIRLMASNGRILMSSEGYNTKISAGKTVVSIVDHFKAGMVDWLPEE